MKAKRFLRLIASIAISCTGAFAAQSAAPPNFVFILVDDMPWFGTPVRMDPARPDSAMAFRQMPNVERLATQGMTFRNARSAAGMCGPSRCSIMTGMMTAHHLYSGNGGFGPKTDGNVTYLTRGQDAQRPLLQPEPQGNIRFPSIGDVLRSARYATAHFGKWHLYGGGPAKHGFDESDGETDNKTWRPIDPATGQNSDTSEDPKFIFSLTQRGLAFMERQARAGKPFYLQLSHYATHAKYQARAATLAKYEKNPVFATIENRREKLHAQLGAAMAEDLDTSIGLVLARLEQLGVAANTFVIFTADNGYRSWNEAHDPLRGAKWWLWDNGVRVPLIIRGPGIAAGSRSTVNVVGYDFLPTFADLAGASARLAKEVDGTSFKPVLLGQPVADSYVNRGLYFHYPHYRIAPPSSAIVAGDLKLQHFYEWPADNFVYDLRTDLGEKNNLAKAQPDQTARLHRQLMERLKAAGAFFPKPNPGADPKAKRYDPNNLLDLGDGDDPEVAGDDLPRKKSGKAKAKK
jgi:arylsulfatase A-like enzyme